MKHTIYFPYKEHKVIPLTYECAFPPSEGIPVVQVVRGMLTAAKLDKLSPNEREALFEWKHFP